MNIQAEARSAAAERMRLHRERRRKGLRCLTIELRESEIDALVRMGLLRAECVTMQVPLSRRCMRISTEDWVK